MPYVNNNNQKIFITDDKFVQLLMRDYNSVSAQLLNYGIFTSVGGEGFVNYMNSMKPEETAADIRATEILRRLPSCDHLSVMMEGYLTGVEVGVFAGELSKRLLSREDVLLYMVDSWTTHDDGEYAKSDDFHAKLTQEQQDGFYELTKKVTEFAGERANIIRKDSVKAAKKFEDESLDFVFIDADHSYEGCKKDLEAWWPKVKKGGLFSGHDYENTDYTKFGVKKAVDEFADKYGLQVELGDNFTWFIHK